LSTGASRNPVLLAAIVLAFTAALGAGAYGLNQVVNPPPPKPSTLSGATLPTGNSCAAHKHQPVASPVRAFSSPPPMTIDQTSVYTAYVCTSKGLMTIQLRADAAPLTVNNFVFLARGGFFDGLTWHRYVPDFVIQGGDPKGDGTGGPGYQFADETVKGSYELGSVAMANSGANTNGSQFFIGIGSQVKTLAPKYNLFGQVTAGLEVAKALRQGDKILWVDAVAAAPSSAPSPIPQATPAPSPSPS
jgi:cyclophilin family peptidyl-prolyl cis-trans isomerase